jgi:hypothetical protein
MNRGQILISRILLGISFLTLSMLAYFFYAPYMFASWWQQIGQAFAMVIKTSAPLAFCLTFTLIWPKPGGIISLLYGVLQIWLAFSSPDFTIPSPLIALLYMLFTAGGILSYWGAGPRKSIQQPTRLLSRMLSTARAAAFGPVFLNIVVYGFLRPSAIPYSIPGIITAGIAYFWQGPGGVLMLFIGGYTSHLLYGSNWEVMLKLPGYIFCALFGLSGILHIFIACRDRNVMG